VTDQGGVDDRSFNQTAYEGLERARDELGIEIAVLESQSETDFEPNIEAFLGQDCDLIVTVGFLLGDVTEAAAQANPDQNFAIVDYAYEDDYDNLRELVFATDQAAFLAGYVAAGVTETGIVGTYGGINIPTVSIFMDGYLAGVNYYNEENGTDVEVEGWDGSDGSVHRQLRVAGRRPQRDRLAARRRARTSSCRSPARSVSAPPRRSRTSAPAR
jgi:basic membrane protein A and related proteins